MTIPPQSDLAGARSPAVGRRDGSEVALVMPRRDAEAGAGGLALRFFVNGAEAAQLTCELDRLADIQAEHVGGP